MAKKQLGFKLCAQCEKIYVMVAARSSSYSHKGGFCSRECWVTHAKQRHSKPTIGRRKGRFHEMSYRKRYFKSPAKTVEEDLAWMYNENPGMLLSEDKRKSGRRTGGAGSRHTPHARLLK